jgi:1,5-anhydro-D-fructose reductase (1,5-anhydro-D-mannitol-forming)
MEMHDAQTPRIRWALVGTSEFAVDWIAPAIGASPVAELGAVVSSSAVRAREVAQRLGAPIQTDDLGSLDATQVDVVHLVTPNALHLPQTITALERGLHVVVEKPMALSVREAEAMLDAARASGRMLFVAHCMAWAPPVATAARLVQDGQVGTPVELRIAAGFDSQPSGAWRQGSPAEGGGGPWMDLGPHAVDAAVRIMGPVESVSCVIDRLVHDYPAEDTVSALLRFSSGAHGAITTTFVAGQNELSILGTAGRLRSGEWLGRDFAGDLSFEPSDHGVGRFDIDHVTGARDIPLERTNVYGPQVDEVSRAIRDGGTTRIDGANGLHVMRVLMAAIRSARTGARVSVERR